MCETISVIVPVYNVEAELPRCVESILGQTWPALEILLVDDGSTDGCPGLCDDYARQDPRVRVIHQENGGLSAARNAGLQAAAGSYVLYVDSDDYLEPDACQQLLAGMLDGSVSFVLGSMQREEGGGTRIYRQTAVQPGKKYPAREFVLRAVKKRELMSMAWLCLYRRDFLLENDLWFCRGRYFEDMELLPRLYLAAENVVYVDHVFYHYVARSSSIMGSLADSRKREDAFRNYREWKRLFDGLTDRELQAAFYGLLITCYLHSCRDYHVTTWKRIPCGASFAWKYALNAKERIKVACFTLLPWLYVRL